MALHTKMDAFTEFEFRYSENTNKKFEQNSHFVLTLLSNFEKGLEIFSNFVAFSQYLNFTSFCFFYKKLHVQFVHT